LVKAPVQARKVDKSRQSYIVGPCLNYFLMDLKLNSNDIAASILGEDSGDISFSRRGTLLETKCLILSLSGGNIDEVESRRIDCWDGDPRLSDDEISALRAMVGEGWKIPGSRIVVKLDLDVPVARFAEEVRDLILDLIADNGSVDGPTDLVEAEGEDHGGPILTRDIGTLAAMYLSKRKYNVVAGDSDLLSRFDEEKLKALSGFSDEAVEQKGRELLFLLSTEVLKEILSAGFGDFCSSDNPFRELSVEGVTFWAPHMELISNRKLVSSEQMKFFVEEMFELSLDQTMPPLGVYSQRVNNQMRSPGYIDDFVVAVDRFYVLMESIEVDWEECFTNYRVISEVFLLRYPEIGDRWRLYAYITTVSEIFRFLGPELAEILGDRNIAHLCEREIKPRDLKYKRNMEDKFNFSSENGGKLVKMIKSEKTKLVAAGSLAEFDLRHKMIVDDWCRFFDYPDNLRAFLGGRLFFMSDNVVATVCKNDLLADEPAYLDLLDALDPEKWEVATNLFLNRKEEISVNGIVSIINDAA